MGLLPAVFSPFFFPKFNKWSKARMSLNVIPRYQHTYRIDEINLIIRLARRGESLGFVGMAGVGKSNIVNFLRHVQQNAPQVEQDVKRLHFPIVNSAQWPGTPDSLWKMMVEALDQATTELSPPQEDRKVIPFSGDERAFKTLQTRLKWLCQELGHQVMFVLDDFDRVLEVGPLAMLEQLDGLRSDDNREFLSYLVFTKRLPHILGQNHPLENKSKFYDLFRPNIYALEPYTQNDAMQMLRHLNGVAGNPLSDSDLEQIYQLVGGHARLLKLVFNIWVEEKLSGIRTTYFAEKPDIKQECERILLNLHDQEREVALLLVRGLAKAEHQDIINHLTRRGMLVKTEPMTWFSPLMAQILGNYQGGGVL
jgi:ABC-type dipeptide/oligopeptide/nickel transport system ATPase component